MQAGRSQGSPKGVSQTPGASRRSIAPAWGEEMEDGLPGAAKNTGEGACADAGGKRKSPDENAP